jgi:hypothetical protein
MYHINTKEMVVNLKKLLCKKYESRSKIVTRTCLRAGFSFFRLIRMNSRSIKC